MRLRLLLNLKRSQTANITSWADVEFSNAVMLKGLYENEKEIKDVVYFAHIDMLDMIKRVYILTGYGRRDKMILKPPQHMPLSPNNLLSSTNFFVLSVKTNLSVLQPSVWL